MSADGFRIIQTPRVTCCEPTPNQESMDSIKGMRSGQWYLVFRVEAVFKMLYCRRMGNDEESIWLAVKRAAPRGCFGSSS